MKMMVMALVSSFVLVPACGDDEALPDGRMRFQEAGPSVPDASGFVDASPDAMEISVQLTLTGPTSIDEGQSGTYPVTLTGDTLPAGETVTVTINTGPGVNPNLNDASASGDYDTIDPVDSDIIFTGGGATTAMRTISTVDDILSEGDEDFLVVLQNPRSSSPDIRVTINSSGIVGVVIVDDDA